MATSAAIAGAIAPAVLKWLKRAGAARRAVDMKTTVIVERPVAEVFEFCRDFHNFPRIMDVLLSVEDTQDGRSHWAVRSPTGEAIEWDAMVTKYVPSTVIAWESTATSNVRASGIIRFDPIGPGETRVDIEVTYLPLTTNLGEALHALSGESNTDRVRGSVVEASRDLPRGQAPLA